MAQSSFDSVAICYVLPVLWMTSCFHTVRDQWGRIKHDVTFRRSSPGGSTGRRSIRLQCPVEFVRSDRLRGGTKSAVYDWLVVVLRLCCRKMRRTAVVLAASCGRPYCLFCYWLRWRSRWTPYTDRLTVRYARFFHAGVMPNMSHCRITRSTRVAGIIKPNPKSSRRNK